MELMSNVCDICGRSYKQPVHMDSSQIQVKFADPTRTRIYDFKACTHCAGKIMKYIIDIQRNRPKKCEFCEFERGPLTTKPAECTACTDYDNFKVKKRMSPRQSYEWAIYMGYLGGEKT